MHETVTLESDDRGVATLVLNRPEKHNAMSGRMIEELTGIAAELADSPALRVVILAARGATFCAGGDLGWMKQQMAADRDTRFAEARKLADMLFAMNTLPQPVIGAIQGNAFGGGLGLASICDVAIGADNAKMGFTEARLGLIPATISPYCIARMGEARARRVFMSARIFDAQEAVELGLLSRAVAAGDLTAAIEAEVAPYLACAPGAVAASKRLARALGPRIDADVIDFTVHKLVEQWETPEAAQGIAAFFDRRKPDWA